MSKLPVTIFQAIHSFIHIPELSVFDQAPKHNIMTNIIGKLHVEVYCSSAPKTRAICNVMIRLRSTPRSCTSNNSELASFYFVIFRAPTPSKRCDVSTVNGSVQPLKRKKG
jgi:hypothetical protein